MEIKNSNQDSMEENDNPNMQDQGDEAEETLSFCDLPIYGDAKAVDQWEKSSKDSKEDQSFPSSSSFNSADQDLFEFFSEEWRSASSSDIYPVQNIVFCGKLIRFKEPVSESGHDLESDNKDKKNGKKCGFFRWNSKIFRRCRTASNGSKLTAMKDRCTKKKNQLHGDKYGGCKAAKSSEKCGFSVRRVSILLSPAKPWRQLLMFGLAGLPAEMELRDIRRRQCRRSPAVLFRLDGYREKSGGVRGLWGLIRSLSCGGFRRRPNTVVTAESGGVPNA
ncbi:hypothetical protein U1Q18_047283 [Sarracenia purpurea var. burkii]